MILYILLGLVAYIVYSIGVTIFALNYKVVKEPWWAAVLIIPAMPFAYILGWMLNPFRK